MSVSFTPSERKNAVHLLPGAVDDGGVFRGSDHLSRPGPAESEEVIIRSASG